MSIKRMTITFLSIMSTSLVTTSSALALDLYVDNDTQQIYAAPGLNRVKLGSFEKKEDIDKLKATLKTEIEQELKSKQLIQTKINDKPVKASLDTSVDYRDSINESQAQEKTKKG